MINMPDLTFARYILETSLTEYKVNVATSESLVAATILVVALKIRQTKGWQQAFKFYAGYTMTDLAPLAKDILKMLNKMPSEHLKTIRQKYSHRLVTVPFFGVRSFIFRFKRYLKYSGHLL